MNETQPQEIRLMPPHSLAEHELKLVGSIAAERLTNWPSFAAWLVEVVATEMARREFDVQPASLDAGGVAGQALPEWNYQETADALAGSWVLTQLPVTQAMGEFFDDVHKLVVNHSVAMLEMKGC